MSATRPPESLPPLQDPDVRRVCLVRARVGLGDLLCSAPAMRALREQRPDLRVTLVSWPEVAALVSRLGHVDEVLPFPGVDGIPDRPPDPAGWDRFVAGARRRRFDLAVQAYGDRPAANRVAAAVGARLVGGFAPTGWDPPAGTEALHLPYPTQAHEVERHLLALERLGLVRRPGDARMDFPVTGAEEARHASWLAGRELRPGSYAVLHPGASSPSRRWPVASYAEVARRLHRRGLQIVLTGGPAERPLVRELADACAVPVLDLSGRTGLAALALVLRDSAVLVGNDTGTAHLAASVGARSVTIFQPGDPARWGYTGPFVRALTPEVGCAPCPYLVCPIDFRCSRSTTATHVVDAVLEVLAA